MVYDFEADFKEMIKTAMKESGEYDEETFEEDWIDCQGSEELLAIKKGIKSSQLYKMASGK